MVQGKQILAGSFWKPKKNKYSIPLKCNLVKILEKYGFKVSSLYIAQIKDKCGLGKERTGNNWKKNDKSKEPQCTPEKEEAIRDAFKNFNMI